MHWPRLFNLFMVWGCRTEVKVALKIGSYILLLKQKKRCSPGSRSVTSNCDPHTPPQASSPGKRRREEIYKWRYFKEEDMSVSPASSQLDDDATIMEMVCLKSFEFQAAFELL